MHTQLSGKPASAASASTQRPQQQLAHGWGAYLRIIEVEGIPAHDGLRRRCGRVRQNPGGRGGSPHCRRHGGAQGLLVQLRSKILPPHGRGSLFFIHSFTQRNSA